VPRRIAIERHITFGTVSSMYGRFLCDPFIRNAPSCFHPIKSAQRAKKRLLTLFHFGWLALGEIPLHNNFMGVLTAWPSLPFFLWAKIASTRQQNVQ
jgi:hypothetical protein